MFNAARARRDGENASRGGAELSLAGACWARRAEYELSLTGSLRGPHAIAHLGAARSGGIDILEEAQEPRLGGLQAAVRFELVMQPGCSCTISIATCYRDHFEATMTGTDAVMRVDRLIPI